MIEGLFFLLDIFFAVALVYWVYAADSSLGEGSRGLFRWVQPTPDQRTGSNVGHDLLGQRRDLGKR